MAQENKRAVTISEASFDEQFRREGTLLKRLLFWMFPETCCTVAITAANRAYERSQIDSHQLHEICATAWRLCPPYCARRTIQFALKETHDQQATNEVVHESISTLTNSLKEADIELVKPTAEKE